MIGGCFQHLVYFLIIISVIRDARSEANDVFQHLNLDYPGLEQVKNAYQEGNLSIAKSELLKYFQTRENRKFDEFEFEYDKDRAEQNVNNIFFIKSSLHEFGDKIDWTWTHEDNQWQFSLNRMKWFLNYVGVYQQTKDEKYVRAWKRQIESWIELGDPGYPRTIDTGRRLQNWTISYWMFVHEFKSPSITPEFNAKMLQSMAEQAEFLYQSEHWRRYSNWGTFENSGLSLVVLMFPEFERCEAWLREIWFRMRFQLSESYHEDGMHIEVSPSYHSHELEVWFDFVRLAKANSVESPWHPQIPLPPLRKLFLQPSLALIHFYKPTGVMPQVGDTDERDERNFLIKLGKFWEWPELVYVATAGKEGEPPEKTSVAFPDGGYYIMRSGWGQKELPFNEELFLLFDCGTNEPWHAHFDMLNIVATAYGFDLLKDPGRFTYTQGEERDYFKSTAAHNTIVIDGEDQPRRYTPPRALWHSLVGFDYVVGTQSSHPQITHQRSIFFAKPEYWIVVDRLMGSGSHRYDQYWHLSDEALEKVKIKSNRQRVAVPHLLLFSLLQEVKVSLEDGWIARHYGQKKKAPVIRYSLQGKPPIVWPILLYPFKSEVPELKVHRLEIENTLDTSRAVALLISSGKGTDFFFEQEKAGGICKVKELETDAKMVFIRSDAQERILEYQMVGGSYLNYLGKKVAHIIGTRADVSVQNERVEIEGKCILSFKLGILGTPDVFLNGQKIEVERKANIIHFSRKNGN